MDTVFVVLRSPDIVSAYRLAFYLPLIPAFYPAYDLSWFVASGALGQAWRDVLWICLRWFVNLCPHCAAQKNAYRFHSLNHSCYPHVHSCAFGFNDESLEEAESNVWCRDTGRWFERRVQGRSLSLFKCTFAHFKHQKLIQRIEMACYEINQHIQNVLDWTSWSTAVPSNWLLAPVPSVHGVGIQWLDLNTK